MLITETFHSIQGEGTMTGVPMFFIRTNRCNLRCTWCDSTYTFTGGTEVQLGDLVASSLEAWEKWICFTGGEPLLQRDALEFVSQVTANGKKVLIETGGSLPISEYTSFKGTVIDMDVKTPSSGEHGSIRLDNLRHLREHDYIKFVISDSEDYNYAISFMKDNEYRGAAIFQPAYGKEYKWIPERLKEDRIDARFMLQLHKQLWGEARGK